MDKKNGEKVSAHEQRVPGRNFVSTAAAAKILGVNERHVRVLAAANKITSQRVGRAYLIDADSLGNWERHPTRGRPKRQRRAEMAKIAAKRKGKKP